MLDEASIRMCLRFAEDDLRGWQEPDGHLLPSEPDADERERVRERLRAAIFVYRRVLGEESGR